MKNDIRKIRKYFWLSINSGNTIMLSVGKPEFDGNGYWPSKFYTSCPYIIGGEMIIYGKNDLDTLCKKRVELSTSETSKRKCILIFRVADWGCSTINLKKGVTYYVYER